MNLEEEFINFVTELFPSINPYTKEQVKNSIKQFNDKGETFSCFNDCELSGICQGDILTNITFLKVQENGSITKYVGDGLVLSNSCDIENDDYILISPFYSFRDAGFDSKQTQNVKKNLVYGYMFFPDESREEVFTDFSQIISLPKSYFTNGISSGKIKKKHSLSLVGYYLFICKLTVHFLRPEDTEVQSERKHYSFVNLRNKKDNICQTKK